MLCKKCGNTLPEGSKFCPFCGASQAAPAWKPVVEERNYSMSSDFSAAGDLEARNILIERNLRLVPHIMKKY